METSFTGKEGGYSKQHHGMKLWSMKGELAEQTAGIKDVRARLNAQFKQQYAESKNKNVSSEYWQQVDAKVQQQMKQHAVSSSHV